MKLTEHFTYEEMTRSFEGARRGLDNTPPESVIPNIRVAAELLEEVRFVLGKPIHVHSCYRAPAINKLVGGKPNSLHLQGIPVDFSCPEFGSVIMVAHTIAASRIKFGKLIYEFGDSASGGWVHLQPGTERKLFTINQHGTFSGIRQ